MVNVWGRFFDDLKKSGYKVKAVIDEVKSW